MIKCHHGRVAYYCRLCPGPGICVHGEQKARCTTCSPATVWKHYQKDAQQMFRVFSISIDEMVSIMSQPCYYCGDADPSQQRSIEWRDNKGDYILSNCLSCCKVCNLMKGKLSTNDFISKAQVISERFPRNPFD